jgi:group I intron endonuclease
MFVIYQIMNNVNGKSYIGFTTKTLSQRWKQHLRAAKDKGSNRVLLSAIRKYGDKSFSFCILEEGWNSEIGKSVREPYWISVLTPEYNMTAGGEGVVGYRHTPNQNHRKSIRMRGNKYRSRPYSEEEKKKQSIRLMGHSVSQETKNKIGNANRGKRRTTEQNALRSQRMIGKRRGSYRVKSIL